MDIEEARQVLWLKSDPRPLGELLDEGYLTKERLEWAVRWAYNQRLKEAAQILLEAIAGQAKIEEKSKSTQEPPADDTFPIGMSIETARNTLWSFSPYKCQAIGKLVESKQLTLKDLGYAIENAWDDKVRQAAIALALVRLKQIVKEPAPSAGYMQVIAGGRSYSERKQTKLTLLEGMIFGFLFTMMLIVVILYLIRVSSPVASTGKSISDIVKTPGGIIAIILVAGIFIAVGILSTVLPNQIMNRLDKQIEEYRRGQEGEEKVAYLIGQVLDGNWFLFRNIRLPGRNKGDLDLVLVGPSGIWVFEVKNFSGKYRNIGDTWEYTKARKWKPLSRNPSRQVKNEAGRLAYFLKADNIKVFVNGVVVWANPESPLTVENPSAAVWLYNNLPEELGNILQGEKLSQAERDKIIEKLTKLCEVEKRKDNPSKKKAG
jgi:hypothetical protein